MKSKRAKAKKTLGRREMKKTRGGLLPAVQKLSTGAIKDNAVTTGKIADNGI